MQLSSVEIAMRGSRISIYPPLQRVHVCLAQESMPSQSWHGAGACVSTGDPVVTKIKAIW